MKIDLDYIAALAKLKIAKGQKKNFSQEFGKVLSFVDQIESITSGPEKETSSKNNSYRDDTTDRNLTLSPQDALANAPKKKNDFFVTEGVFGED